MAVHLPPPVVYSEADSQFVNPTSAVFGTGLGSGTYVIGPDIAPETSSQSLSITSETAVQSCTAILWGRGGNGAGGVLGNPAGDLIGGAGGSGLAYLINITPGSLSSTSSITFSLIGGCGAMTFTDTAATRAVGGVGTATKTIIAPAGTSGSAATYSVGTHANGNGGVGGGRLYGATLIGAAAPDVLDVVSAFNAPPAGFNSWGILMSSLEVSYYLGSNGVGGNGGAIATAPLTFSTTVQNEPAGSAGLAAGAGGAGCGSSSILSPGSGGSGAVVVYNINTQTPTA